jgi:hypothetical protein
MIDVVKESFDIKVHYKVMIEAMPQRLIHRIMRTLTRAVTKRVRVKDGFQLLFQMGPDYLLGNPVQKSWNTQKPGSSSFLWYAQLPDRRWKVCARTKSVPEFVEMWNWIGIQLFPCHPIYAGASFV